MAATLDRLTGRLVKAINEIENNDKKLTRVGKKFGKNAAALSKELVRPSDKQLDALAKFYEAVNVWASVCVDFVDDTADIVGETTKIVRKKRNDNGHYTIRQFVASVEKAVEKSKKKKSQKRPDTGDQPMVH